MTKKAQKKIKKWPDIKYITHSVSSSAAGGFIFKQWKERYLVLTMEGSLLVCRDAESPPDQVVALQTNCESIAEGPAILDLPKLPPGGRRDCCFALILPQNKFLLLLTDNPDDCKWVPPPPTQKHTHTNTQWNSKVLCPSHYQLCTAPADILTHIGRYITLLIPEGKLGHSVHSVQMQ